MSTNDSTDDSPRLSKASGDGNHPQSQMVPVLNINTTERLSMQSGTKKTSTDADQETILARCTNYLPSLSIEVLLFIFMFSFFARSVCVVNLFMEKACNFRLNYSKEICQDLTNKNNSKYKNEVEQLANDYSLYNAFVLMAPGVFAMMFYGPWSNQYGRKPPLIVVILGVFLDDAILILNTVYMELPMDYMLFASIPSGITGSFVAVKTLLSSMASDVTPKSRKTLRFALIEFGNFFGVAMGQLVGGILFDTKYTYFSVFGFTIIGNAVCIPWALFAVKETRGETNKVSWRTKLKDLFTCDNFVDGFKCCIKVRENYGRCQIFMLLASMCTIMITYEAFAEIGYLFAFHIYGWGVGKYSEVNTLFMVSGLVVSLFCVPLFLRYLKVGDAGLGLIGTTSIAGKFVMTALSEKREWLYYTGGVFGSFSGMSLMAVRGRISKLVHNDEIVKIFIFLSVCETVIPLSGKALIVYIFDTSLGYFPGEAYMVGAGLLVIALVTFGWIAFLKDDKYKLMKDSKGEQPD